MEKPDKDTLEKLVDEYGLRLVVDTLSDICFDKENHVMTNWQDNGLAELWNTDGKRLMQTAIKILNWRS